MAGKWTMLMVMAVAIIIGEMIGRGEGQLVENFYGNRCPNLEAIVRQAVSAKAAQNIPTVPATLRLFFHDCFVETIDANPGVAANMLVVDGSIHILPGH
ncbi:hypothetical protein CRG98_014776 [Punica granatum]|uniref:peroxidase n=1 Tax=Punica granatum TaxID=22663 RepID=A0A2I0K8J8_PUNGR|nr:hypothetical protein CRG98_014776 [Punica granatum]